MSHKKRVKRDAAGSEVINLCQVKSGQTGNIYVDKKDIAIYDDKFPYDLKMIKIELKCHQCWLIEPETLKSFLLRKINKKLLENVQIHVKKLANGGIMVY